MSDSQDSRADEPATDDDQAACSDAGRSGLSRRQFVEVASAAGVVGLVNAKLEGVVALQRSVSQGRSMPITLTVNGQRRAVTVDPRATLLDTLRERLDLVGTKKGCDRGECGACTVHVEGRRVLSCMTLAVMQQGRAITTIEGLANGDTLHPVQAAFIEHDGFQCGYCTPGQIMSAVACIAEGHAGTAAEIREWMSGNICRCSAYPNIVNAVQAAAGSQR